VTLTHFSSTALRRELITCLAFSRLAFPRPLFLAPLYEGQILIFFVTKLGKYRFAMAFVDIDARLSLISGPFGENVEYLVVADYSQQNIYQLKPQSSEVRAILMRPCHPVSVTFDSSINGLYMICVEDIQNSGGEKQYRIRKKTFDGKINQVIYNAPQSTFVWDIALIYYLLKLKSIAYG